MIYVILCIYIYRKKNPFYLVVLSVRLPYSFYILVILFKMLLQTIKKIVFKIINKNILIIYINNKKHVYILINMLKI